MRFGAVLAAVGAAEQWQGITVASVADETRTTE